MLAVLHVSYKTPPPPSILENTPQEADIKVDPFFQIPGKPLKEPGLTYVNDNNLFDPTRGVDDSDQNVVVEQTIKQNQLELMGLFKFGEMKGAIISSTAAKAKNELEKKQFYKVGEKIAGTSYILQDVKPAEELAVVSLGPTQYILKLERDDKASEVRRKIAVAASNARIKSSNLSIKTGKKQKGKNIRNKHINKKNVKRVRQNPKNKVKKKKYKRPTAVKRNTMNISGRQRLNFRR
jgi:hypothetical protein